MEQYFLMGVALLIAVLLGAILSAKFKQPSLMGLLLIGAVIGPNALNLIHDMTVIELSTNIGIIMIMFIIGLKLDYHLVKSMGFKALLIGIFKIGIIFFLGYQTSLLLGLGSLTSIFMGVMLSFSSTVVIVKVMEEKGMMERREAPLLISILILEDIFAIFMLTLFTTFEQHYKAGMMMVLEKLIIAIVLMLVTYVVLVKLLRFLIGFVLKHSGEEYIVFMGFLLMLLFSYGTYLLNLSWAIGAFIAGSIIGSLPNSKAFEHAISPYSHVATAFFFIAMGAFVDFRFILKYSYIIVIMLVIAFLSRFVAVGLFTYLFASFKSEQSITSSVLMFSVGEFSLILAKQGMRLGSSIDLITISSAIIFVSALFMTISLGFTSHFRKPLGQDITKSWRRDLYNLSGCIKSIFESLDVENRYSRIIKSEGMRFFAYLFLFFLIIYGSFRTFNYMVIKNIENLFVIVGLLFIILSLLSLTLFKIYTKLRNIFINLDTLLLYFTNIKLKKYSVQIIFFGSLSMILIIISLFFPLFMFINKLDVKYNIISIILLIIGMFLTNRTLWLISHFYYGERVAFKKNIQRPVF